LETKEREICLLMGHKWHQSRRGGFEI